MRRSRVLLWSLLSLALVAGLMLQSMPAFANNVHPPHVKAAKHTMAGGLVYQDIKVGKGPCPKSGDTVVVNYTGWLTNGRKFDSSLNPGRQPFSFILGRQQVIKGWEEGVSTMHVGGTRLLTIPASLAYGDRGAGNVIPPGATLIFQVQLLHIYR